MNECIVLMVAIDKKTMDEVYLGIEFEMENDILPKNNPTDINRCVQICNSQDIPYECIDMYGIVVNGVVDKWEVSDE